ncbi:MAG: type III pantothenate kinase, partial [Solirubrobacterales bacterium]
RGHNRRMLLVVDVGNTQTHVGSFEGTELIEHWRFATDPEATSDQLAVRVGSLLGLREKRLDQVDGAIVSSVVPQLAPEYERMARDYLDEECLLVGPALKTGMPIRVDNPHELGADRLVNAVASHDLVDGACITVDFGTSTNFDVVSAEGEYLGGVIGPGLEISIEALASRTAKLPRMDLTEPEHAIGRNTEEALESGFVYGFAGLVDGINRRLADELGAEPEVIATGGLAASVAPHCETIDRVDDLLTLTGLRLIYERNA